MNTDQFKLELSGLKLAENLSKRPCAGDALDEMETVPVCGALVDEDHLVREPADKGLWALGRLMVGRANHVGIVHEGITLPLKEELQRSALEKCKDVS